MAIVGLSVLIFSLMMGRPRQLVSPAQLSQDIYKPQKQAADHAIERLHIRGPKKGFRVMRAARWRPIDAIRPFR